MTTTPPRRWLAIALSTLLLPLAAVHAALPDKLALSDGWLLQSSRQIDVAPEVLSTTSFEPQHWRQTKLPATVLAAQVAGGEFTDIFRSDNLRKLPGMRPASEGGAPNTYDVPWWFRTEFRLPPEFKGRKVWLHFNGINPKANVWLNGRMLADATEAAGAFRIFEFDATPFVSPDKTNVLAVQIFPPTEDDFDINLVDWIPTPPDRNMGLWRDVYLTASGPVRVRYPAVATHFTDDSLQRADLTVRTELCNDTAAPVAGVLRGGFGNVLLEKRVALAPGEKRSVVFTPDEYPQLRIAQPELWWPAG